MSMTACITRAAPLVSAAAAARPRCLAAAAAAPRPALAPAGLRGSSLCGTPLAARTAAVAAPTGRRQVGMRVTACLISCFRCKPSSGGGFRRSRCSAGQLPPLPGMPPALLTQANFRVRSLARVMTLTFVINH